MFTPLHPQKLHLKKKWAMSVKFIGKVRYG